MNKARHAFGQTSGVQAALQAGTINSRDILFLDEGTEPKIGWVNKAGDDFVVIKDKEYVIPVSVLPTESGETDVIYLFNNEGYVWNGTECVSLAEGTDISGFKEEVNTKFSGLQEEVNGKVDEATVNTMIETALADASAEIEVVEF